MRTPKIILRSSSTIVQQMNVQNTKDVMSDIFNNRPVDVNPRSGVQTFDFDDQSKVDFDKIDSSSPLFRGFESLIDQHCRASKVYEHLNPKKPVPSDPPPVPEPSVTEPSPAPAE